jgi:catechol 2,3-dioxygenase-like lactoylglutathione lyase family enzyme
MSMTDARTDEGGIASVKNVDMKLEVVTIPVSDIDRATDFYVGLGWRQDVTPPGSGIVQLTPSGSSCSVQFGTNRTSAEPGSAQNTFLIVSDIQAAYDYLMGRGVEVSEVFHLGPDGPVGGAAPEHASYGSLATFKDPDGNSWLLQEITTRCRDGLMPPRPGSHRRRTWRVRFGGQRPRTVSTRSVLGKVMRTGPIGMRSTWWRSRQGRSCRGDRL